jgi:acyl carrier protein
VPKSATGHAGRVPTTVAEIAAEVLAKTPESIRTQAPRESFVGLGGSSMDAVRLLALCERRLGRTLDLARLLSSSPLADVLAEATACQVMADPAGRTDQLREILPAQRGLLMAEAPGAKGALRTLVSAELTGPLDGAALHETLRWIVARHEALRTVFVRLGELEFARRVLPACEPYIMRQRLRIAPGDSGARVVHEQLRSAADHLIAPFRQPPVAFVLTEFGERHHLLSLVTHQVIADGWAAGLLWREILEHYQALVAGTVASCADAPAPSPDLILSRFVELEASGRLGELARVRVAQLIGVPTVVELPTDLPRPARLIPRATQLAFGLSDAARHGCEEVASRAKVTRNVVILAAWALAVARQAGMAECVIGGFAARRPTADLMRTVASCVAPIAIRCAFPPDVSTGDYVRATSRSLADAVASADVPLESLVADLGLPEDARRLPLVQVMFSPVDEFLPAMLEMGDLKVTFHEGHFAATFADVVLYVQRWNSAPRLVIEYTTSVLMPDEAAELAGAVEETLCEFARHYDDPLSEVGARSVGR